MSKRFKSQASSSRAASGAVGFGTFGGFSSTSQQAAGSSSSLSYISEPPNLSHIFDAQIVVLFKNLLKKDSTTKAKALEDLQGFVTAQETKGDALEDGILEAWVRFILRKELFINKISELIVITFILYYQVNLYPRISIDSSRRVRQLAHSIQGLIVSITGKRIARHIAKVVGAWLAGLYDNDKLVQRAAQESIYTAFATEEKRQGIWKVYQSQIIDFAIDAVLHQTAQTLSDERSVSPDEAESKHARVVAAGIQLFNQLLGKQAFKPV